MDSISCLKHDARNGAIVLTEANGNGAGEIKLHTNNGDEVYFDVTVTNHVDHDEIRGMVVFMYDITERRVIQKKARERKTSSRPRHL